MFKRLLKDSLVYGVANAIQKLGPFIILPIIVHYLGQNALKVYDVSFVYAYIFSRLVILGQDAAASVLYFDTKKSSFNKSQVTTYGFIVQLIGLLVFFCLVFPFSHLWSRFLFSKDAAIAEWCYRALYILPGSILLNYALNILLWQNRKTAYAFLCFIQTITSIAGVLVAVIFLRGGIAALFYSLVGSTTITGFIGLMMIKQMIFAPLLPLNKDLLRKLFLLGIPFALTTFFHQLLPAVDRLFLIAYNYGQQLAPYVLAAKLGSLLNFGVSAFVLAFTPYSLAKLNEEDAEEELARLFRMVAAAGFLVVPFLLLFKDLLIHLFADASYAPAAPLLPFFFFGWVFDLFSYFTTLGIYRSQKSLLWLILFIVGVVFTSAFNQLLIPYLGLHGAALSFCLGKAILFFISWLWLRKYFYLHIHLFEFWSSFVIAIVSSYLIFVLPLVMNIFILLFVFCVSAWYFKRKTGGFRKMATAAFKFGNKI